MIRLNLKLIKYTKKIKIKNPRCDVHMLPKKLIPKKLYLRLLFLGGFVCFHLDHVNVDFTILLFARENSLSNNIRYKWGWILKVLVCMCVGVDLWVCIPKWKPYLTWCGIDVVVKNVMGMPQGNTLEHNGIDGHNSGVHIKKMS